MNVILAADVGGTKANLAMYDISGRGRPGAPVRQMSYPSAAYPGLINILSDFLGGAGGGIRIASAVFGIAGPIVDGNVQPTNLPWAVDHTRLPAFLGTLRVRLRNDLEMTAYGLLFLPPTDFHVLNAGESHPANRAVIAAGTGLGEAFLHWDGRRYRPVATEGGHVDFAPRTDREVALLNHLRRRFGRVSYERVLSGPGLVNIFEFLVNELGMTIEPEVEARMKTDDPAAVIGETGVAGACETCVEALNMFSSIYGAQAGNVALATMATGGLYVAGGIAPRILPRLVAEGRFMRAFTDKGRSSALMAGIPVSVVLNPRAALIGAAEAAADLLG